MNDMNTLRNLMNKLDFLIVCVLLSYI